MKTRLNSESGSTFLMALVAIISLALIVSRVVSWLNHEMRQRQTVSIVAAAKLLRTNVLNRIENDQAWLNTINANPGLNCFLTDGADCTGVNQEFELRGADDSVYIRVVPSAAAAAPAFRNGFNALLEPCDTFDPVVAPGRGNDKCPFRYRLRVQTICGVPPCLASKAAAEPFAKTPRVRITAILDYRPAKAGDFDGRVDEAKYTINHIRGELGFSAADVAAVCANFYSGVYNAATGKCDINTYRIGVCPPYYYFDGVDAGGVPLCRQILFVNSRCKNLSAVVGIGPWGEFSCGKF